MTTIAKLTPEQKAERAKEMFRRDLAYQYQNAVAEIPEKFRFVNEKIQPSTKSRLPLEEQAKLYKEITQDSEWNKGWAFFAPAGYGKTTASWLLYKYAIRNNLAHALRTGESEFTIGWQREHGYTPCYCWHIVLPEYLAASLVHRLVALRKVGRRKLVNPIAEFAGDGHA